MVRLECRRLGCPLAFLLIRGVSHLKGARLEAICGQCMEGLFHIFGRLVGGIWTTSFLKIKRLKVTSHTGGACMRKSKEKAYFWQF